MSGRYGSVVELVEFVVRFWHVAMSANDTDDSASNDLGRMRGTVVLDEAGLEIRSWRDLRYLDEHEKTTRQVREGQ